MTRTHDFDRIAEVWLAEGPTVLADRVLDAALDEIHLTRQRRGPVSLSWRTRPMNLYAKLAVAAIAVVAVVAVGAVGLGFAGREDLPGTGAGAAPSSASPPPSASPSPSPTPTSTPPWQPASDTTCGPDGAPCLGPLAAGTYQSTSLTPALTYTITGPWINTEDWPDYFQLIPDTPQDRAASAGDQVAHQILVEPWSETIVGTACDGSEVPVGGADPQAFAAEIAGREGLVTTRPFQVAQAGLTGMQIDATVAPGWTATCAEDPSRPAVEIFPGELLYSGDHVRYIALGMPDGNLMRIKLLAPDADFRAFAGLATPVINTFVFDLGQ